jgi:cytochrome c biogenesis factor
MSQQNVRTPEVEAAQGRFVGRVLIAPVAFSLLLLGAWVVLATVITPGARSGDDFAADQRLLRAVLITFGLLIDGSATGLVLWRLTHWPSSA